jgi:transcription elongation factor GreA
MAVTYMSAEGYKKLKEELNELERVHRPAISKQIAEARDKGDLSENAEYDAAKEAQGMLEMKISQLKEMLATARMIDESKINTNEVQILNRVKIKNSKTGQIMTYMIVSESEANLKEGKLSVTTPIARGLLGKKVGEKASVQVPSGLMELEVVEITL